MHKQNIADFILYDMAQNRTQDGSGAGSGLISDIVEGWDRNIYVTPPDNIRFFRQNPKHRLN